MDIQQRLERLELENRRLRFSGLFVLTLGLLAWTLSTVPQAEGQARSRTISTQQLDILDNDGEVVFRLRGATAGGALIVKDNEGRARMFIGVTPDGPGVVMNDSAGNPRVALELSETAGPSLTLQGLNSDTLAKLVVANEGGMLLTSNAEGRPSGFPRSAFQPEEGPGGPPPIPDGGRIATDEDDEPAEEDDDAS